MRRATLVALMIFAGLSGSAARAGQNSGWTLPSAQQQQHPSDPNHAGPPDPGQVKLQEQQAKKQNDERQRKLVSDTAKLYDLAEELKDEVGKTDKNTLSVDVVKKAEEIERLAKSVKERMRG